MNCPRLLLALPGIVATWIGVWIVQGWAPDVPDRRQAMAAEAGEWRHMPRRTCELSALSASIGVRTHIEDLGPASRARTGCPQNPATL